MQNKLIFLSLICIKKAVIHMNNSPYFFNIIEAMLS